MEDAGGAGVYVGRGKSWGCSAAAAIVALLLLAPLAGDVATRA